MRRANGTGGVVKLSGNRRNPYAVRITDGWDTYVDKDGKVRSKQKYVILSTHPTRIEADLALALYNKDPRDPQMLKITFKHAFELALAEKDYVKSTLRGHLAAYKKLTNLHKKRIHEITQIMLQKEVEHFPSESTQLQAKRTLNLVFIWAIQNKIISENPVELVITTKKDSHREGNPYTKTEMELFWQHSHEDDVARNLIQIYIGTRIEEMLKIKKKDVHFDEMYIEIHGSKTINADRIVPIREDILPLIQRFYNQPNNSEYLFVGVKGGTMTKDLYYKSYFRPMMKRLAVTGHIPHDARHTFVSCADSSNINQSALKIMIGHTLKGVTGKVYTHKSIEDLRKEINKIQFV